MGGVSERGRSQLLWQHGEEVCCRLRLVGTDVLHPRRDGFGQVVGSGGKRLDGMRCCSTIVNGGTLTTEMNSWLLACSTSHGGKSTDG